MMINSNGIPFKSDTDDYSRNDLYDLAIQLRLLQKGVDIDGRSTSNQERLLEQHIPNIYLSVASDPICLLSKFTNNRCNSCIIKWRDFNILKNLKYQSSNKEYMCEKIERAVNGTLNFNINDQQRVSDGALDALIDTLRTKRREEITSR